MISLMRRNAANCTALKNLGLVSETSSATLVGSDVGAVASVGVRFNGAGGVVASRGGGAGEVGRGELLLAGC